MSKRLIKIEIINLAYEYGIYKDGKLILCLKDKENAELIKDIIKVDAEYKRYKPKEIKKSKILDKLAYDTQYKCYRAKDCRETGLPMVDYGYSNYIKYADKWLSKTRCKKIKQEVKEGEEPVAFLRVMYGYVPLYLRDEGDKNGSQA